jgi:Spy/CpxP family protein refolding chaperone
MTEIPAMPRRRRRLALAAIAGTIVAGAGAFAYAQMPPGPGFGPWHGPGPGGWMSGDPATMQRRTEGMVKMMLADVNASPEQEKRIAEIMAATMTEMRPLREKHMDARRQVMALLSQPTIDRGALETIRVQEMQLADTMSRRMVQSMVDAAEVLTPEQRTKLAERMKERRGPPRS